MKIHKSRWEGAFWKTLSCLCFASINGIIRYLSTQENTLPSVELAFFQNLFGLLFLIPWFVYHGPKTWRTQHLTLHIWRALASGVGIVLWYLSLAFIPIAQAVSLGFMGPLFTTLGARLVLKEPLGVNRSIAILLGILGGVTISHARYLSGECAWFSLELIFLIPIASTLAFSTSTLMSKHLTQFDSPALIVALLMLLITPCLSIPCFFMWVTPTLAQLSWLFLLGGLASAAHFSMNKAFVCADVTFLIPFGSTRLIASILIGFFCFYEIPSIWTLGGTTLIMTAILFLGYQERKMPSPLAAKA
ncbi:MAG: DMT family transporter [Alphaproteobacteria bacterium]